MLKWTIIDSDKGILVFENKYSILHLLENKYIFWTLSRYTIQWNREMNKLAIFGRKQIFWPANFHKICQVPYRIRWSPLLGGQLFLSSIALYGQSIHSITAYYRKIISDIYLYEAEKAYPTNPPGVVLVSIRSSHRMQTWKFLLL